MTTTTKLVSVARPDVVEYLRPTCGDLATGVAAWLPGLTVDMLKALDALLRDCHGCQTNVEVAWFRGELHYRATGPVLSSGDLEYWAAGHADNCPYAITHDLQWSGIARKDSGCTAGDLAYRLAGQPDYS